jgi:hypothetical protein
MNTEPTKKQWAIWKQEIRKWMEEHRSAYVRGGIDILIEDAITTVGNPYNLDPDELYDIAFNVLDPEY